MMKFLDGKKTLLGVIIEQTPILIQSVGAIFSAAGGNAEDYARVTGYVIAVIGLIYKFIKDA